MNLAKFTMSATEFYDQEEYLYNPELLENLDWASVYQHLNPPISNTQPGKEWLLVRPLKLSDFNKGYLQILSQLTTVGNISKDDFGSQFHKMRQSGGYYITVIEDTKTNEIIGSATLLVELKFIHERASRGRLGDVVVNTIYRGKQLGKLLVLTVTLLSKKLGCFIMTLECKDNLIAFYKSLGYKLEPGFANFMITIFARPDMVLTI